MQSCFLFVFLGPKKLFQSMVNKFLDNLSRIVIGKDHGAGQGKIIGHINLIVFRSLIAHQYQDSPREKLCVISWAHVVFRIVQAQDFA